MKIISINLNKLREKESTSAKDIAKDIAEGIANAIFDKIIEDTEKTEEIESALRGDAPETDVDHLSKEEVENFAATNEEYKAFQAEFQKRVNDLIHFTGANQKKFNSAVIVSGITLGAESACAHGIAMSGSGKMLKRAIYNAIENPVIESLLTAEEDNDVDNTSDNSDSQKAE